MECSTPYSSAPSSPCANEALFGLPLFHSCPPSPTHSLLSASSPISPYSHQPYDSDFEFSGAGRTTMTSADELFLNGKIRPLDPDARADPRLWRKVKSRRTRSMSPLRTPAFGLLDDHAAPCEHQKDPNDGSEEKEPSSAGRNSKRWEFLKDFLYRSKSEGSTSTSSSNKFWAQITKEKPKKSHCKKKKTYLPYREGLIGCLGFSSVNGFSRVLNQLSSKS